MSQHESEPIERFVDADGVTHDVWKRALREGVLLGQRCVDCGHQTAAPKAACARCGERDLDSVELPTEGVVYAETTVMVPPEQFDGTYQVALVDLGPALVMAHIDGAVEIGDDVELAGAIESGDDPGPVFG